MPNGSDGRRDYNYNPRWCEDRHHEIDKKFDGIWGEHGFGAVWNRMDNLEKKLWGIILGLALNLGGVVTLLLQMMLKG